MPRNSSGNYTLPSGNPVVTRTVISSSWANTTLADVATELTSSLDRNGRGPMLAALQLANGTSGAPALTFAAEPTSGLYRSGTNDLRLQVAATLVQQLLTTGVAMPLGLTLSQSQTNTAALTATGNGNAAGGVFTGGSSSGAGGTFTGGGTSGVGGQFTGTTGRGAVGITVAASDPTSPNDGDMWVSGSGSSYALKVRMNGATYTVAKTWDATTLTLTSGFTGTAYVWVDAGGMTHLEGIITNATGSAQIDLTGTGAIPSTFRPSANIIVPVIGNASSIYSTYALVIRSDGKLALTGTLANGAILYLDSVTWRLGR